MGPRYQGDGIRRDSREFDKAIIDACAVHQTDPSAFVDQVSSSLDLSAADMRKAIDDACLRFGAGEPRNLSDSYGPDTFDLLPPAIVAVLGDAPAAATLVDEYCATEPVATSVPAPR